MHRAPDRTLLIADIDFFKAVNDTHGHRVGDEVLVGVAGLLKKGVRESDIAVRWGGEEFLLVLRGCDLSEGARLAANLRVAVGKAPLGAAAQPLHATIRIGASEFNGNEHPDQTINRADTALYEAKRSGRNRVCRA